MVAGNVIMALRMKKLQEEIAKATQAGIDAALQATSGIQQTIQTVIENPIKNIGIIPQPIGSIGGSISDSLKPVFISSIADIQNSTSSTSSTLTTLPIQDTSKTSLPPILSNITSSPDLPAQPSGGVGNSTNYTTPIVLIVLGLSVYFLTKK